MKKLLLSVWVSIIIYCRMTNACHPERSEGS